MTISTEVRKAQFAGNDSATNFAFTFKVFSDEDVVLTHTNAADTETLLVLDADYSVALNADQDANPGGSITYPLAGDPLATGSKITVTSDVAETQGTVLPNGGGWFPKTIERALDRLTILSQQIREVLERAVRIPVSDSISSVEVPAAASRANRLLGFDSNGDITTHSVDVTVYGVQRSDHTATAGQTLFNLSFSYVPGVNALAVYLNGSRMRLNVDYTETSSTALTFSYGLQEDDEVVAFGGQDIAPVGSTLATNVSYSPAGAGAVATNVQAKLRESVSVLDFAGVDPTGVADSTAGIQAAIDAHSSIHFPAGTYRATTLALNSNNQLFGDGWSTIIHQVSGTEARPGAYDGLFTLNYDNSATSIKNVSIRDMQLKVDSVTGTYDNDDEIMHVVLGGHIENLQLDNIYFNGWRGDAVFVGAQMDGVGVPTNYVALRTSITNCAFNGVNNKTRQAITGGSVDGLYINNNYFLNTTGDMPGAIDIEPELVGAYTRNISVTNNIFVGIGAAGARRRAFVVDTGNLNSATPERIGNITFADNYLNTTDGVRFTGTASSGVVITNVKVEGNWFYGTESTNNFLFVDTLTIRDNHFDDCKTLLIGYTNAASSNVRITGNTFNTCGIAAAAIQIDESNSVELCSNTFNDCGLTAGGPAIQLAGNATTTAVHIHDNTFTTPGTITTACVDVAGTHTQDTKSHIHDNILRNSITGPTGWTADNSQYETGTWTPTLGGTATYLAQSGVYTKIGKLVKAHGVVYVNVIGTGSQTVIAGLPYAIDSTGGGAVGEVPSFGGVATAVVSFALNVVGTNITVSGLTAAATTNQAAITTFTNSTYFEFSVTYRTA